MYVVNNSEYDIIQAHLWLKVAKGTSSGFKYPLFKIKSNEMLPLKVKLISR